MPALRGAGFRIAIDNVGTGISGLDNFGKLSPDFAKLDRSAYAGIEKDANRQRTVRAMYAMLASLEVPLIADLQKVYGPKGLAVIGPTRLYGYAAGGEDASPAAEKLYIEKVRQVFYAGLPGMPAPLSAANFQAYGASTTPTIVLIDPGGIVRFYHPGALPEQELSARIQAILKK